MGSINLLLLFFILFFHFAHAANSSSHSGCIETERKALLEFKAGLVSGSSSLSSWTGLDCCSWDGITCHTLTGHVQSLFLGVHNFSSPLSPWLFNLTHLEVLTMLDCGLRGPIPNMFDKLTSLTHLDLSLNTFVPSLPPSLFNLTHLQVLSMSSSGLRGPIPNMFDKLTSLIHLDLSDNSCDSAVFPDSLCSLTNLTYMDLTLSGLQGSLPLCLGNLTSLTKLDVRYNQLSGEIPSTLGNLTSLTNLYLSQNRFSSSIPSTLGNLRDLKKLFLQDNQLSGELPESVLEGLKSLLHLDISKNHHLVLNVSPQWIPPFQLLYIGMGSVFVGTEFPKWLQSQTNLKELLMMNTSISGAIPGWCLTAFPNLIHIDLSNNFLSGSVPTFDTASLSTLQLSRNQFSGNIPQQFCNLTSLWILSLGSNQLIGTIPSCLGAVRSLRMLDLGNNSLFGHIPNELGSISNLLYLHLQGNRLSGKLPESLQNLTFLVTLDLGDNKLQGSIPKWIGKNWSYMAFLRLESNNFSGEIPVNLCQLPSLQILNLALNNLVGTIPPCLGNLSMMLSNESGPVSGHYTYNDALLNIIKGREMEYTSSLPYAKFISLSSNHLHGQIPVELMDLKGLQSLDLSNNDLTGMIPDAINKLEHLESLDLSMNRLSGTIPQSLANIDALSYLNLSFNNLAGKIPSGNHFDTLSDPSIYEGNLRLCGKPLKKSCPGDDSTTFNQPNGPGVVDADEEFNQMSWMYAGIGPGFAVGFLTVVFILYFKHPWRTAYFGFVDNVYNKVMVTLTIKIGQFQRKFN